MEEKFLKEKLRENGLKVTTPKTSEEIKEIDRIIFDELCKGKVKESYKKYYIETIKNMVKEVNIKGVILGCTEIEMLIKQEDIDIPLFDTTQSHIDCIVDYAIEKKS